jgi:glutamate:GABA antiporter
VLGLGVGKWLHNIGAVGVWVPALLLLVLAAVSWSRFGSATEFTAESLVPSWAQAHHLLVHHRVLPERPGERV